MDIMGGTMKKILLYIWQLPQNLLGLLVIKFTKAVHKRSNSLDYWFTDKYSFGVSLGRYIILGKHFSTRTLHHEHGHQIQSLYLGWLYLILIGLPSAIGNLVDRVIPYDYYSTIWEHTADVLGGIKR